MSIKNTNEDDNIIFEDFENRLEIKLSPEVKIPDNYDHGNYLLADLLSWLRSFNNSIYEIRKELGMQKLFRYPDKATVKKLVDILMKLDSDKRATLRQRAEMIVKSYHLTENWQASVEIAILTHTFVVPPKESIRIYLPSYFYPQEKADKKTRTLIGPAKNVTRMRLPPEVVKYPAIYFTRQATIDELKKWINKHKQIIRDMQYSLPRERRIRRELKTLFWGKIAWILKQDGVRSWSKMAEIIGKMIDQSIEDSGVEPDDEDFTLAYPTSVELEKHFKRFKESLQKLNSS